MYLLADAFGVMCVLIVYMCVSFTDYVILNFILLPMLQQHLMAAIALIAFYHFLILMLLLSHFRAILTDPGRLPLPSSNEHQSSAQHAADTGNYKVEWTYCHRCMIMRPPRAHHCRVCARCIRRMDHHCPWINNCVGEFNQKYFIQAALYGSLLGTTSVLLITYSVIWQGKQEMGVQLACMAIAGLIGSMYGILMAVVVIMQTCAIIKDETTVESVKYAKNYERPEKRKMDLCREVFGNNNPLLWLLPCFSALTEHRDVSCGLRAV